jgi:serine/threonine protein kinase/nucleoside phosphorylase/outer membrane protein assembly factor BamD (BamD/ComL family)
VSQKAKVTDKRDPATSSPDTQANSILIVTATKMEAQAVLEVFSQATGKAWIRQPIGNKTYYNLGAHGGAPVFMVQSEIGTATPGGALLTVHQAIQDLQPQAVIMCGIAFGLRPDKQQLGDILVAKQLQYYEPQKVALQQGQMPRGDRITSSERLLDRFRSGDNDWQGAQTHFGLVLSGEKLVDDPAFRDWLLKTEPEAVGGEMEGAGLYAAARDAKVDWILVKAICDWADGKKDDVAQPLAARNAAQFVLHVLQLGGWRRLEQLHSLIQTTRSEAERRARGRKSVTQESTSPGFPSVPEELPPSTEMASSLKGDPLPRRSQIAPITKGQLILKKYKILGPLGSGAFGDVYLAEDMDLKRKVAIKHLKTEYATNEEALERFRKEARTIAGLKHQNIAVVYGMDKENDQSYIVLEYAEKGTLAGFIKKEGPLPIILAIDLAIALCHALTAVHRQGIFHRDIKPGNILLVASEDTIIPKLSDFGLASGSQSDRPISTPQYTSPEQLDGGLGDTRSDVYSLGAVLYEMLTGKPPFTRKGDEGLHGLPEQIPPSLRNSRKEISPSLENVVLKALAYEPTERYQTTRAMAKDLEVARQREFENEEDVRNSYIQAEQCISDQNWLMAVEVLERVYFLNPNYKDTAQLLAEARKQVTLAAMYERARAALSRRDWVEAEERSQEVLDVDKAYKDAADVLEEVKKQKQLLLLYTGARQLEEEKEWSGAILKYAQISAIEPDYEDVPQRLAEAGKRNRLKLLYDQANALFVEKNWQKAADKFQEVLALDPQYEEAVSKAGEAKMHAHSQVLYAEGMEYLSNNEWQGAIAKFSQICSLDPGYEAVDARLAEAERQKKLQNLYDQGLACRGQKDWQGAIEKFTQVLSENPEYETVAKLLEEAKWRQTQEETMTKPSKENPFNAWWAAQDSTMKAALIGLIGVFVLACSALGGVFLDNWLKTHNAPIPSSVTPLTGTPNFLPPTVTALSTMITSATNTPTLSPSSMATTIPSPTDTPSPTNTPTATPYPPPTLTSPSDGALFQEGQDVKLIWEWKGQLEKTEFFEVRIRLQGEQKFDQIGLTKLSYHIVPATDLPQAGLYEWQVAIVSLPGEEKDKSQVWSFSIR